MATVRLDQLPSTQTAGTKAPTQAASSVAGEAFTVFASDATAGSANAGAAAGGTLNLQGGDAKRLTSGNGNGGDVVLEPGAAIGSGTAGKVIVRQNGGVAGTDELQLYDNGTDSFVHSKNAKLRLVAGDNDTRMFTDNAVLTATGLKAWDGTSVKFQGDVNRLKVVSGLQYTWDADATTISGTTDTGLKRVVATVVAPTDGSSGAGWIQNTAGESRVTTSDVTNTTITPAAITGLSATLIAGRKYAGELVLYCNEATAADGLRIDFDGGSATMTSFIAQGYLSDDNGFQAIARVTALATDITNTLITGSTIVVIKFAMVVNGAGTFIPRFAKEADAAGAALTVTVNSHMTIRDVP